MSPNLHAEIAFARQREIAAGTTHARHVVGLPSRAGRPRRMITSRIGQGVAALGACLAITTALAVSGANAGQSHRSSARPSAQQVERSIGKLRSQGYVPVECTTKGTLLRNARTGRFVTVVW